MRRTSVPAHVFDPVDGVFQWRQRVVPEHGRRVSGVFPVPICTKRRERTTVSLDDEPRQCTGLSAGPASRKNIYLSPILRIPTDFMYERVDDDNI